MLRDYPGKVTIKIDGLAASAASVIAMAGDTVLVSPVSMIMIHNPSTVAMGNSAEMQKAIEMLDEVKNSIINAYQVKTGLSRNKLSKLMDEETWMDAGKAVELHFADAVTERNSLYGKTTEADPDEEEKDTPPDEDLEDYKTPGMLFFRSRVAAAMNQKLCDYVKTHEPEPEAADDTHRIDELEKRLDLMKKFI